MKPVQAGKLRHRVTIQRPKEGMDEYGDPLLQWSDIGERWASVEPLSGREQIEAFSVEATITHRVRFRAQDIDVSPRDRILTRTGRILEVKAALNVEERTRVYEVLATEVDNG